MNRFVLANANLCIGCNTCMAACAEAHEAKGLQAQPRISIVRSGDISLPIACRHCENAPCMDVCPVDAIKMSDGAVTLLEEKCIGCKLCAFACPFGVIALSGGSAKGGASKKAPEGENAGSAVAPEASANLKKKARTIAVKCDLCDFSKDGPECVRVCPTNALFLVDDKMLKRSSSTKRKAATNTMPSIDPFTDTKK